MFNFYWPWLALLAPLPLLLRWLVKPLQDNGSTRAPMIRFPDLTPLRAAFAAPTALSNASNKVLLVCLWGLWIALVIALMRPQWVESFTDVQHKGYDLMLAVDLSGSMQALDFSTRTEMVSRLDMTKRVVGKFVEARQGDRVGLIVFGEHAYMQVPLTLDTAAVKQMLDNTISGMAGPSTAIGDAIGLAVRNLRDRPEESRVIILLTDGEDTASSLPPLEAAKLAKQYNIRIYAIGMGKRGMVPFPTQHGGVAMANIPIDEDLLKKIAKLTKGAYFRATNAQALQAIYNKINHLEKTDAEVREYMIREPLYHYPLAVAAALLLLLCLLPLARQVRHGF